MTDLVTRTPDQLARATAAPPDALFILQQPGGPVQSIALAKLFGSITNADVVAASAEDAGLDYGEGTSAYFYAPAPPDQAGYYIKSGASGAGSWQFNNAISDLITAAVAAVMDAATALAVLAGHYANDGTDVDVPGGAAGERGAKFYNLQAQTASAAISAKIGNLTRAGLYSTTSVSSPYPLLVDQTGQIIVSLDPATGRIVARFNGTDAGFRTAATAALAPSTGFVRTTNQSAIAFPFCDASGNLMFGLDVANQRPIGLMAPVREASPGVPLAVADQPVISDWTGLWIYGQSLGTGADSGDLISTTQPFHNITFAGGPRSGAEQGGSTAATAPLVEVAGPAGSQVDGESPVSGAALRASRDALLKGVVDPSGMVLFAASGASSGKDIAEISKGTAPYTSLMNQISAAHALAVAAGKGLSIPGMIFIQGENDANVNYGNYAAYRAALIQLRLDVEADVQAMTGQSEPVAFLLYQTAIASKWLRNGYPASQTDDSIGVQRAQLDVCNTEAHFHFVTPCWWFPPAPAPGLSNVHLSSVGYHWMGQYFGRAWSELVVQKIKPRSLRPMGAIATSGRIRIKFDVPVKPLVLDVTNIAAYTNYGFEVQDDTGLMTLDNSAFSISPGGDELVIKLPRPLGANPFVRGAMGYLKSGEVKTYTCGANLRDSCTDTATIAGAEYPLWYLCPHFSLPIYVLS